MGKEKNQGQSDFSGAQVLADHKRNSGIGQPRKLKKFVGSSGYEYLEKHQKNQWLVRNASF